MNLNIPPNKMKINSLIAGICLFFSSLFSCQQKGDFKSVSVEDFSTLIANPEIQRLDVRTVAEYSESHIPKSININVLDKTFAEIADSTLQKDKPVALYCRSGKRSKKGCRYTQRKGIRGLRPRQRFRRMEKSRKGNRGIIREKRW